MLDLQNYVPYLLNRAGARIARAFTEVVRAHGLTLAMWRALAVLSEQDGLRLGELAERTAIDLSTLSRVVGALERKGLARRRRGRDDSRAAEISLSAAGRRLAGRLIPVALRYEAAAVAGFTGQERETLKAMLRRLYGNMAALEDAASDPATGARIAIARRPRQR